MKANRSFQTLEAQVAAAERTSTPSALYHLLWVGLAFGLLVLFLLLGILLPLQGLRGLLASSAGASSALVAYGVGLAWAVIGCIRAMRLWLQGRLFLALRFGGDASATPVLKVAPAPLLSDDVAGALAAAPVLSSFLGPIYALRQREESIERELDKRLHPSRHKWMITKRAMLRQAMNFGIGLSFFVGLFGAIFFLEQLPENFPQNISPTLRLTLGCLLTVFSAMPVAYAAYHVLRMARQTVSLGMLAQLKAPERRTR